MIFDTHMHCEYSCDSEMTLADALAAAAAQGIGLTVTEHWDYDYPTNPEAFLFDIGEYLERLGSLQKRQPQLLAGIEIGMQTHTGAEDERIAAAYPFDFVLGSIHCIGRRDLYEKTCYEGRTRAQIVEEFLKDSIACLESHSNFDAFAHIDYICRYWPYEGEEAHLRLGDSPELFDRLLGLLAEAGKPLEINTRRLDSAANIRALLPLYRRYHELGGRYCTIGSDAHYREHVGRRLQQALALAREAELAPVYFKARKMFLMEV